MGNDGLDDSQPGIKTAGRNINNLRYGDDTTLRQKAKRILAGCSPWGVAKESDTS